MNKTKLAVIFLLVTGVFTISLIPNKAEAMYKPSPGHQPVVLFTIYGDPPPGWGGGHKPPPEHPKDIPKNAKKTPAPADDKTKDKEPAEEAPVDQSGKVASPTEQAWIAWHSGSLAEALQAAGTAKKVVYGYFYFRDKDDFPKTYDKTLQEYSEEKAVCTKIFGSTNDKGNITFPEDVAELFKTHKLVAGPTGIIFDYYGNVMTKLVQGAAVAPNKITAAIGEARKKIADTENRLKQMAAKAAKLEKDGQTAVSPALMRDKTPELIKTLKDIASIPLKGYGEIENASAKLAEMDKDCRLKYESIIKELTSTGAAERKPDATIKQLDELLKTYKGLPEPRDGKTRPVEKEIKELIELIRKGKTPALPEPVRAAEQAGAKYE